MTAETERKARQVVADAIMLAWGALQTDSCGHEIAADDVLRALQEAGYSVSNKEPRGCPTPGACSCVPQPSPVGDDCAKLRDNLSQALRQWRMYAELDEDRDLEKEASTEAELYRELAAALASPPSFSMEPGEISTFLAKGHER